MSCSQQRVLLTVAPSSSRPAGASRRSRAAMTRLWKLAMALSIVTLYICGCEGDPRSAGPGHLARPLRYEASSCQSLEHRREPRRQLDCLRWLYRA